MVGAYYVTNGVVAGCGFATTMIRINSIPALDSLVFGPGISLDVYIDDYGLSCTGSPTDVAKLLPAAAADLRLRTPCFEVVLKSAPAAPVLSVW